jgi:hypothetical protein
MLDDGVCLYLEVIMRKVFHVFATMAVIIALIGMWVRFAPIATQSVTAERAEPSARMIAPFELMSRTSKALPNQYYRDPF